ncbi:MAG: two-component regulator propeller domain-containing protein [Lentimicrobiaceae bacterium]|nr:two-component regulator propeller domain-containing protein [Lentimicrobiaceae bacterium]
MKSYPVILLSAICLMFPFGLKAQYSMHYIERVSYTDGLSSNNINDVLCDSKGYLWIATDNGLNRYDGTEIIQIFKDKSSFSMPGNWVRRLLPVDDNHIAVATYAGLAIIDITTFRFRQVQLPFDSVWGGLGYNIAHIEKDGQGNFWVATPIAAYYLNRDFKVLDTINTPLTPADIGSKRLFFITHILPLTDSKTLIRVYKKFSLWSSQGNILRKSNLDKEISKTLNDTDNFKNFFVQNNYLCSFVDKQHKIVVYDFKIKKIYQFEFDVKDYPLISDLYYDVKNNKIALFLEYGGYRWLSINENAGNISLSVDTTVYLHDIRIKRWYQDPANNTWLITYDEGDLLKIIATKQKFNTIELRLKNKDKNIVHDAECIFIDNDKWLIGSYGSGLFEFNHKTSELIHYNLGNGVYDVNLIWNIGRHSKDTLWIGTQKGLLWYNQKNHRSGYLHQPHPEQLDNHAITNQFTDSYGMVWMGLGGKNGICVYNSNNGEFIYFPGEKDAFPFRYPYGIGEDKQGDIWFITDASAHVGKWSRKENKFIKYIISEFTKTPISASGGFYLDKENECIWYGVNSVGLVRFDINTHKITVYGDIYGLSTRQGLLDCQARRNRWNR